MQTTNKILIIDDDEDDKTFLAEAIRELYPNLPFAAVNNGAEALQYLQSDPPPPTLIFLDLNMPVLNGYEFLKSYQKKNPGKQSNIVIYSTSSNPRDKEITESLGASEYVTKLGNFSQLKCKVQEMVSKYC